MHRGAQSLRDSSVCPLLNLGGSKWWDSGLPAGCGDGKSARAESAHTMKSLLHVLFAVCLLLSFLPAVRAQGKATNEFQQGIERANKGDMDGAIASWTAWLKKNPKDANAYDNRGSAKANKGDFDGAVADHSRAIELNPKDAGAYNNRGTAEAHKGDLDAAIADYSRAIELNPKHADAYLGRGAAGYVQRTG